MHSLLKPSKLILTLAIVLGLLLTPAVLAQNSLVLSAATDKAQYAPGETVRITGRVLDNQSNPVAGASVSIQVNDPPIHVDLIISDQSGSYSDQFALPTTAPSGVYNVYVSAGKSGYVTTQQQIQFIVSAQSATSMAQSTITVTSMISLTSTTQTSPQTKCFIATATFGSELAPEVVLLRTFRDSGILRTSAGRNFMMVFNAFYYSFSPQVASLITLNAPLRYVMQAALYPLIEILSISYTIFNLLPFNRELGVVLAGVFAALGIGIVYLGPITVGIYRLRRFNKSSTRSLSRAAGTVCFASLLLLVAGEAFEAPSFLMVGSVSTILSFTFLGPVCALQFARLLKNQRFTR